MSPGPAINPPSALSVPQSLLSPKQAPSVRFRSLFFPPQLLLLSPRGWRTQIFGISLSLQSKFSSLTGDISSYQQFFPGNAGKGLSGVFSDPPCKVLETFRAETSLSAGQRPKLLKMLPYIQVKQSSELLLQGNCFSSTNPAAPANGGW